MKSSLSSTTKKRPVRAPGSLVVTTSTERRADDPLQAEAVHLREVREHHHEGVRDKLLQIRMIQNFFKTYVNMILFYSSLQIKHNSKNEI
jgi:hypothetical protein